MQTDKQNPQYTRTYVDKYLGMGDIHEVLGASAPAADADGFTPADDDGDMPFEPEVLMLEQFPQPLKEARRWVCFDAAKTPINPATGKNAMPNEPST